MQGYGRGKFGVSGGKTTILSVLNIRRSVWRSFVLDETKTHEDKDEPGVVPIIQPLRLMLDRIRPQVGSGWMFANTLEEHSISTTLPTG